MTPPERQDGAAARAELRALVARLLGEPRARELFPEDAGAPEAAAEPIAAVAAPSPEDVARIVDELARVMAENRRLEKLDRLSYALVATATHELRNPLTSIRSFSEILLHKPSLPPGQRADFLKIVVDETERLGRLVSDVLDMAKLEWAQMDWSMQEVDLRDVVTRAADAMGARYGDDEIALALDLPPTPQPVDGDPDRLQQVVVNLLSSALAMAPRRAGRVVVRVRDDDGRVVVSVHDSGPGLPEEELGRVFDKFHQLTAAEPGRPRASGLGLAIAERIVQRHGGTIAAASVQGDGTTVSFSLPRAGHDARPALD